MIERPTHAELFYLEAPDVPAGMTLQTYRRLHNPRRRRGLRRLSILRLAVRH